MIIETTSQELVEVSVGQEQFVAVTDFELMYVGGGTGTGMLF